MRHLRTMVLTVSTALLILSLHAYSQVPPNLSRLTSEPQSMGNGTVRSYVEVDAQNRPSEVGLILSESALSNLPDHVAEIVLPLPDQASLPFDHIGLNWRNHGHDPEPIYGSPHLDVHFYTLTSEEREAITVEQASLEQAYKTPDPDLIPVGYVLAPDSAEPQMGAHWVNPTSEEFQGNPHGFAQTLIYGFYNGEMAFIEPMVSLEFLKSQQDFESAMAVPERYARTGAYPSAYRITYNEATREYTVALTEFVAP